MSNGKWTLMGKLAAVFLLLFAASFIANVVLLSYVDFIQRQVASEPDYVYIVGVVYEERWIRINPRLYELGRVPMYAVKVTLGDEYIYTDSCGYFSFTVEQGTHKENTYELKFEKDGYYTEHRVVYVYSLVHTEVEMKQKITLKGGE